MTNWLAPFLIGLAGSLHCVGMCSPLVMAVSRSGRNSIFRNLQYNLGRILTYGVLGSAVGFAGKGLHLAGIQQWVSIGAGLTLLAMGIAKTRIALPVHMQQSLFRISNILKDHFRQILGSRNAFGSVVLGMINGLLPCGLTLVALGYCVTLDGPWEGSFAMLLFGLGTLPAMVGLASTTSLLIAKLKISYSSIQSGLMIVCALILIGRGIWDHEISANQTTGNSGIVVCGSDGAR